MLLVNLREESATLSQAGVVFYPAGEGGPTDDTLRLRCVLPESDGSADAFVTLSYAWGYYPQSGMTQGIQVGKDASCERLAR